MQNQINAELRGFVTLHNNIGVLDKWSINPITYMFLEFCSTYIGQINIKEVRAK